MQIELCQLHPYIISTEGKFMKDSSCLFTFTQEFFTFPEQVKGFREIKSLK